MMRRTIDVGRMNQRITFMSMEECENELGQSVLKPVGYRTVWASVIPIRDKEVYEAQKLREESVYKIYCRWFGGLKDDSMIKINGMMLEIKSAIDVDYQHTLYEITCVDYVDKDSDE